MGWQDSLAKHHPIPAFFAAVISNIITGNKADNNENSTDSNLYHEPSDDHEYVHSGIQPTHYYHPASPSPSSSSRNKSKKNKNKTYDEDHQTDYYYNPNDNDMRIVTKSKGFWGRRDEHVVEKRRGYGQTGTLTRTYTDSNGEEMMEERDYQLQAYYELQLSPARRVDTRKKNGSYQGAGRSRYN